MRPAVEKVLRKFERRAAKEWEEMQDASKPQRHVDELLLSGGPATGRLINLLAREAQAQTLLEIGSSYGYSTVWLAEAAEATGGKVISLEIHPAKQQHARESVREAGLDGIVQFRLGDALELLAKM